MSYIVCNVLDLGEAYTGVTLNAQLVDISRSPVGGVITTGIDENSGGLGLFDFALTIPDGHQGWCYVYVAGDSGNVIASIPINPAELENADAKTSTRSTFAGGAVASVAGNVGGNVVGSIGSLATQAKADVNAEADTALADAGVTTTVTGRIDAAISSRLASAGYTTPPTVAAIRTEMDSNSTKLANLDATISSRAPSSTALSTAQWTNGRAGNLDNLDAAVSTRLPTSSYTAPTTPPTVTAIRQEMDANSTKLANLDTTVSSRLAASSYSAPPSAATIRSEIDSNSAKLDATVSSRASQSSLNALNNLSQAQAQSAAAAALSAYGAATATNVSDTQAAITTAISALHNLSATDAATAIMAYAMMDARQFQDVVMDVWAVLVGNSSANDATNPTVIDYQNVVTGGQVTHIIDETTRTRD